MAKFMLGRKAGMTQVFDENGLVIPVTVIACGPLTVLQNKTVEKEGYSAVRVGYEETQKGNRPHRGQFEKIGVKPMRVIREFRSDEAYELGRSSLSARCSSGDAVDVCGTSK